MDTLTCNIDDCALIFEGGGMRASYTSALAVLLLEEGIHFSHVYGVSAGSSNTVNYVSRDVWRTRASFTTFARDPNFGSVRSLLRHKGIFNAHYIYQEAGLPGNALPFDIETFLANPAEVTIASIERDSGRTCLWTKVHMRTLEGVMKCVCASSTLPIVMPPLLLNGHYQYDGGLAHDNGILLNAARADGFKKFLVVRTRPKGFRKPLEPSPWVVRFFWRRPAMQQALHAWGPGYNAICDELEKLEQQGRAYVFYAEDMAVSNSTTNVSELLASYDAGMKQAKRDLPAIKSFLGIA